MHSVVLVTAAALHGRVALSTKLTYDWFANLTAGSLLPVEHLSQYNITGQLAIYISDKKYVFQVSDKIFAQIWALVRTPGPRITRRILMKKYGPKARFHLGSSDWVPPEQFFVISSENSNFPQKLLNMKIFSIKFMIKKVILISGAR